MLVMSSNRCEFDVSDLRFLQVNRVVVDSVQLLFQAYKAIVAVKVTVAGQVYVFVRLLPIEVNDKI